MEKPLHIEIRDILKDSSNPENRIFRKVFVLTIALCVGLGVYRHVFLGFMSFESFLATIMLALMVFFVVCFMGGAMTAAFYSSFREAIGATQSRSSFSVFIVECLIALCAPVFGMVLYFVLFQGRDPV